LRPTRSPIRPEQQETAKGDQIAVHHPGEVTLAEVQVALDRRQGDVHDRRIEHHHQLPEAQHRERDPAAALAVSPGWGRSIGRRPALLLDGGAGHVDSFRLRRRNTISRIILYLRIILKSLGSLLA
jgi:hypothetical protein